MNAAEKPGKSGFTLVELLITSGIIGILASISLSAVSNVKTRAREVACKGNQRNLYQNIQISMENEEFGRFFEDYTTIRQDKYLGPKINRINEFSCPGIPECPETFIRELGSWGHESLSGITYGWSISHLLPIPGFPSELEYPSQHANIFDVSRISQDSLWQTESRIKNITGKEVRLSTNLTHRRNNFPRFVATYADGSQKTVKKEQADAFQ